MGGVVRVNHDRAHGNSALAGIFLHDDIRVFKNLNDFVAERRFCRFDVHDGIVLSGLHEVDPFAEERILLGCNLREIQFCGKGSEFSLCEGRTNRDLVVGGQSAGAFGFDTDENGVAELVYGSFGSLHEVADICIGSCEECCRRSACNQLGPDAVFDFLTGGLVECDDSESLFGVAFCMAYGGKRNRFDLVGDFLDRNALENIIVCRRKLLDSVVVDAFVGKAYNGGIAVLGREPELASRCSLAKGCREDAFLEEGVACNGFFVEGVNGQVFVTRVVGVAHKNGLGSGKQNRRGFGKGDRVGIEYDGDVEGLLVGNAKCIGERNFSKNARIVVNGVVQFLEVCTRELVQERAVFLALLGLGLRTFREQARACLGGSLNLGPGPIVGEGVAEVGICVIGVLEVFDEGHAAVAFHFLEMSGQLQMNIEMAPVVAPGLNLAEPLVDA